MNENDWIADGTEAEEPVTVETPEPEVTEEAVVEAVEAVEAESVEVVEATEQTAQEVAQAFIEAKLGEDAYQLPEDVLLPLKRGEEVEYLPVTELMKRGMLEKDYRYKTEQLGTERRAFQTEREQFEAARAKMSAREKYLEEKEAEIRAALTDPKGALAYEEHLRQYEKNPMYRKHVDASLAQRETEAELQTLRAEKDHQIVQEASSTALGWIEQLAESYPSVDPQRVAQMYGQRLKNGEASLDRSEVERLYRTEADYLDRASSPLQQQLAELTAKVEALNASKAADQHNETTQHAVARAKAPKVAATTAAPASARPTTPQKFGPNELAERNAAWARAG